MNKNWQQVVNKHKSKMEAKEHLGNFCFGFWSTRRKWYRVEVLDWMDNEHDKIMVQLIDYGKKLFYSYTNLKGLGDLVYSMFPKLAIRCHLTGICSPHLLNSVWPQKTIDFFVKLSEWTERTEFQVIFAHKDGNSYGVDLRKAGDADADSLGELLVKNGYAFEERVSDEDFLNTLDEKDLEECGDECEGSDDLEKVLSEETNQMSLPLDGEHVEIMVTGYLLDTCHFYARILRNFSTNTYFVDEFRRLIETMNASNTVQGYEAFTLLPEIGEVVLVKEGAAWNRGRCDRYTDIQDVEVFLVDFGYTVVKPFSHLRKMKDEFLQVPFQAVECMLSNCKEKEAVSDEMSLSFFNNVMRMKTFLARVVETTRGVMKLQMWDMDNIEMSQVLKTFGLGEDR